MGVYRDDHENIKELHAVLDEYYDKIDNIIRKIIRDDSYEDFDNSLLDFLNDQDYWYRLSIRDLNQIRKNYNNRKR